MILKSQQNFPLKLTMSCIQPSSARVSSLISTARMFSFVEFDNYGKHFLKSNGLSSDSFIQMALQLTNFRLFKQSMPSRETVSVMHFRYGRTDYVRVASDASDAFVHSMDVSHDATSTLQSRRSRQLFIIIIYYLYTGLPDSASRCSYAGPCPYTR